MGLKLEAIVPYFPFYFFSDLGYRDFYSLKEVSFIMISKEQKTTLALAARGLKLAGLALIGVTLLNMVLLLIPPKLGDSTWWLNLASQLVQQGIVPLLGLGALLGGIGCETLSGIANESDKWVESTKKMGFRIAGILAVVFLALVPIHALSAISASQQAIEKIDRDTAAQLEQIEVQLQQQQQLYRQILESNPDPDTLLEEIVGDEPLSEEQLAQLQEFRENPQAVERQVQAIRSNLVDRIQERGKAAKERSKFGVWKSISRIGLTSLLLSACYFNIARLGVDKSKKPKVKRRPAKQAKKPNARTRKVAIRKPPAGSDDGGFLP